MECDELPICTMSNSPVSCKRRHFNLEALGHGSAGTLSLRLLHSTCPFGFSNLLHQYVQNFDPDISGTVDPTKCQGLTDTAVIIVIDDEHMVPGRIGLHALKL